MTTNIPISDDVARAELVSALYEEVSAEAEREALVAEIERQVLVGAARADLVAIERELRRRRWRDPNVFMDLFEDFKAQSWDEWRKVLSQLSDDVRELYVVAGRGSGKSRIVSLISGCYAVRRYHRVPGERIYIGVFAPDRKQARVTFSYVGGLFHAVPELECLIEREARESIDLTTGVTVEVITASRAAARSRAYALAVVEEAAFLPQEDSADPDIELIRALRPALARVPNSLLAVVSSPYARRGVLWDAWQRYGKPNSPEADDPAVVFVHAPTRTLNPRFDAEAIARARVDDPVAAATEYDAAFRTDVEDFVTREAVMACVATGRFELSPSNRSYIAFVDPSGGRVDSMTLAIGHLEGVRVVIDFITERAAPFSPEAVVKDMAVTLARYRVTSVTGDRYGGEWPREMFRTYGIEYVPSPKPKSDIYRDSLPLLNSGRIELLDNRRLVEQLVGLERRTARGGHDSIDHAPSGHDDVANAVCGVATVLTRVGKQKMAFEVF